MKAPPGESTANGPETPPELDASTETPPAGGTTEKQAAADDADAPKGSEPKEPYEGLDQSGSPPPPPRENGELPSKKWKKDYDGRKDPTRADEVLIWIPRAPLYPVHLVLNYAVRWPIVGLLTLAEKHKVFKRVENFFTFRDGQAGFYPVAFYDAGRGFWGGLNFFYNDLGRKGHDFRATAGIGSNDWILARIKDSWEVFENDRGELTFSATFHRDPTFAFTGLGPDTSIDDQVFFREEKVELAADLQVKLSGLNRFSARIDARRARLGPGRDPAIEESDIAQDATGFEDHFLLTSYGMRLRLDSRNPEDDFVPGSGVAMTSWVDYHYGPGDTPLSFFRYGVYPQVFWDLTDANHVIRLGARSEALSKTGGVDVPYNERVALGGDVLRGFLGGRFRGDSALTYEFEYSWPLLAFANAVVFSELGTTFNGFFEDFNHDLMALTWGTGLTSTFSREIRVTAAIGFGSNQIRYWDDEFHLDNVRFFAGATHRF